MLKRIFAVALAAAMILGMASVAFAASPFPDTEGHEDEGTIALLKTLGLVKGDDLGNFNPDDTITRAEFCAMIVRALGLENSAGFAAYPTQFPDVTPNQAWAYGYINIAVGRGVIKGYPDGTFKPSDPVSQAEALTMVMRALGYKDSLPGNWPLNYIMEGASDGVDLVEAGFAPTASATRAFVAHLVGVMLEKETVVEDKDDRGTFDTTGDLFGYKKLGVEPGPAGVVTAVSTANKTITIAGVAEEYLATVVVYGKVDKVGSLKGYAVKTWVNKNGKILYVNTTVSDYVTGKITAVNVSGGTLTVAGVTYDAVDALDATKNGTALTGSLANKLVALVDTTANIWLNEDGEAYKVEARYLDVSGKKIAQKITSLDSSGLIYKLVFDGDATQYVLASPVTITKNNVAAGWADLKAGDDCSYTLEGGKIVWLDAWKSVIEGVKITSKYQSGTTYQITGVVDDVSTVYLCKDATVFGDVEVGKYYDLSLNRDNKVYDVDDVTVATMKVVSTITGLSIESVSGATPPTVYKVALANGSTVSVPVETIGANKIYKNTMNADPGAPYATYFTDTFKVNDLVYLERVADGSVSLVKLYSPILEGEGNYDSGDFWVSTDDGDTDDLVLASGAPVTLNGATAALADLDGVNVKVTFDASNGKVTKVAGYAFDNTVASAVTSISSDGDGNYTFLVANGDTVEASKNAVVLRGGASAKLADIELGDKLFYSADGEYIEAADDTTAPKLSSSAATYGGGVLTVTLTFDEEVQAPTVWIDGTKHTGDATGVVYTPSSGGKVWTIAWTRTDPGASVSLSLTASDWAGNVLTATPGMVSVTHP